MNEQRPKSKVYKMKHPELYPFPWVARWWHEKGGFDYAFCATYAEACDKLIEKGLL